MTESPSPFRSRIVRDTNTAAKQGIPTLNCHLEDTPSTLRDGIWAARVTLGSTEYAGVLYKGPRTFHAAPPVCEVHILVPFPQDDFIEMDIDPIAYIRPVEHFSNADELVAQIEDDCSKARGILGV